MKNIIGNQILKLRNSRGYTQEDLAEILGFSKQTVSNWETGLKTPRMGAIQKIADHFNVSKSFIIDGKQSTYDISSVYNQLNQERQSKVYNFASKQLEEQNNKVVPMCGETAANPTEISYGDSVVDEQVSTNVPNQADCALVVDGDSMEPVFKNGSIVFYRYQPTVENGEYAIVEIDGTGVTLKKFYYFPENNKVILKSLNDKYGDRELEANRVRILGKAIN